MAEKRENSVHVRLSDDADAIAELLAEAGNIDKNKLVTTLIHEALLGKGYALKVAAMRFARLGLSGSGRE